MSDVDEDDEVEFASTGNIPSAVARKANELGIKVDRISGFGSIRFHDEHGSRPFTVQAGYRAPMAEVLQSLEDETKRMRGIRLMEILEQGWSLDNIDRGQRQLLSRALYALAAHVDGAISVAVDALIERPSEARAILKGTDFAEIALFVAKERRKAIAELEKKSRVEE